MPGNQHEKNTYAEGKIKDSKANSGVDIQGGLGFFLVTSYFFFSLFAQQVIFFKSKLLQVFHFFFEKIH